VEEHFGDGEFRYHASASSAGGAPVVLQGTDIAQCAQGRRMQNRLCEQDHSVTASGPTELCPLPMLLDLQLPTASVTPKGLLWDITHTGACLMSSCLVLAVPTPSLHKPRQHQS